MPVKTSIRLRRGTASDWTSTNPVLAAGEPGVESDTGAIKLGDGTTAWTSLGYALSSRYVPLASARIFLTAQQFGAIGGSPVMGTLGNGANIQSRTAAMLFDAADFECVSATFVMPPSWATFSTHLWWSNAGAGAGDVLWVHYNDQFNDADSSNAAPAGTFATVTAPSQYDLKRTSFSGTTTATAGQLVRITIARSGTNIADTLNNDAGLVAVEIVRAS